MYLNDVSKYIIQLVSAYNRVVMGDGYRCAYTFDAGPNAVLYMESKYLEEVMGVVNVFLYGKNVKGIELIVEGIKGMGISVCVGGLKRVIESSIGEGPRVLADGFMTGLSLLNENGELV